MTAKQFFEVLARLPARVWLQAILAVVAFIVLAVLGFAVIAGVAVVGVVLVFVFKARAWFLGLFGARGGLPARTDRNVTDVKYEIVEKDKTPRR